MKEDEYLIYGLLLGLSSISVDEKRYLSLDGNWKEGADLILCYFEKIKGKSLDFRKILELGYDYGLLSYLHNESSEGYQLSLDKKTARNLLEKWVESEPRISVEDFLNLAGGFQKIFFNQV